jgi:hypothetical protein
MMGRFQPARSDGRLQEGADWQSFRADGSVHIVKMYNLDASHAAWLTGVSLIITKRVETHSVIKICRLYGVVFFLHDILLQ